MLISLFILFVHSHGHWSGGRVVVVVVESEVTVSQWQVKSWQASEKAHQVYGS